MTITINGNGTVTGISVGGLPDGIVDTDTLAADAVTAAKIGSKCFVSYAVICERVAANTNSGDFNTGSWMTKPLNTELTDTDNIVSISSDQFTLIAGTYYIEWTTPGYRVRGHMSRLVDKTNSDTVVGTGTSEYSRDDSYGLTWSKGYCRVTIGASTVYQLQGRCEDSQAGNGMGQNSDMDSTDETYSVVKIFKEA